MITKTKAKQALELVANLLVEKGEISKKEVYLSTGIWGVSQRISELRGIGFDIATTESAGDCYYTLIKAPREHERLISEYKINLAKKRKARKELLIA